jgi:Rod binding domain-containing protein
MNLGISAYSNLAQASPENAFPAYKTNGSSAAGIENSGSQQAQLLKLKKAATQFEAMLLQKWWSSMKQSGLGQDDDGDPGEGTLDNMGMQAMSSAVANSGGVGIAAMLVRSLQGELAAENASKASSAGGNYQQEISPSHNE